MNDIASSLRQTFAIDPSATAVESEDSQWWTWGDLAAVSVKLDALCVQAGLGQGARIGILFRNRPAQLCALLCCAMSKRCAVALNPLLPADMLRADLRSLHLAALVGEAQDFEDADLATVAREAGIAALVMSAQPEPPKALPGLEKPTIAEPPRSPEILVEMLTSGTTGTPKRVALTTDAFSQSNKAATEAYEKNRAGDQKLRLRSGVRILTAPLTHISGISAALMTLASGRRLALLERFRVEPWLDAVARHKPKVANVPPAALRMLLDAQVPAEKLASLIALRTGTAPLDPILIDEFLERYNIPILQNYGATEFAGAVAGWSIQDFRAHSQTKRGAVGRVFDSIGARVVDPESGNTLDPGDEGVLELCGGQVSDGSWIRTTDRAVLDADRFLWIRGRYDNAIIRGGFKVHADDVSAVLEQHIAIREAAVVGIPDRRLGEVPGAAIILANGASAPAETEMAAFLKERLLPYQIPARFIYLDELPRTTSMKPSLTDVRALFTN